MDALERVVVVVVVVVVVDGDDDDASVAVWLKIISTTIHCFALVLLHLADGGGTHQRDASGEGLPP